MAAVEGLGDARRRAVAYLQDPEVPAEERGRMLFAPWCHACVVTALDATALASLGVSAYGVWRHREAGLRQALMAGVSWPGLGAVAGGWAAYAAVRRTGSARAPVGATQKGSA
ncbi:MAG: hypothetical protein ACRDQA_22150 [Nocardioidaceae bacterium]